jgi:hypothetical protein
MKNIIVEIPAVLKTTKEEIVILIDFENLRLDLNQFAIQSNHKLLMKD